MIGAIVLNVLIGTIVCIEMVAAIGVAWGKGTNSASRKGAWIHARWAKLFKVV